MAVFHFLKNKFGESNSGVLLGSGVYCADGLRRVAVEKTYFTVLDRLSDPFVVRIFS